MLLPDDPTLEPAAPADEAGGPVGGGPAAPPVKDKPVAPKPTQCPPGQQLINGRCRHAGDMPCPPGSCKDVATGACRSFNPRREKINETDIQERSTGGGRGYCKQMSAGGAGRMGAGGGGGTADAEDQYFQRLVDQGDWTEWPPGSGQYFNDPGNDRSKRVWVDRRNLQLDSTGRGYRSVTDPSRGPAGPYAGAGGGGAGGPAPPGGGGDVASLIQSTFEGILKGGQTRFSPEVMADIAASAQGQQQAEILSGTAASDEDLARRGLAFSPAGAAQTQKVRSEAAGRFDATMRDARTKKAFHDFEDRLQGLKAAQDFLTQQQQYALGLDQHAVQREQTAASLALGRERIAADAKSLLAQIASSRDLASMQIGSTEFMFMQRQLLCLQQPTSC